MAFVFADRVKETTTSIGLGSFTLDGAVTSFRTFATGVGTGNSTFYVIENDADSTWEVGVGTVTGASLSRDSVLSSSNGGAPVSFAGGTKQVFASEAAQHFNNVLDETKHDLLDHTGLTGVPAAEAFDAATHLTVDHTAGPLSLLDEPVHDLLDHTGLTGVLSVEAYDQAAHDADDHTGVTPIAPPSQAEAETGTATIARLWTALRVAQAIAAQTGLQVAAGFFASQTTITQATGFQPKLAIFAGRYEGVSTVPTIGYSIGTGGANQGCTMAGGVGIEGTTGAIAADAGGDAAVDQSHAVTTFDATSVIATQTTGATAWTGIVFVLGG